MDPILKWPGGKRSELGLILPAVPAHTRVIEPFAGGAAVALALEPAELWLNDIESDLIDLYRRVAAGTPTTERRFTDLATAWSLVATSATALAEPLETGALSDADAATTFATAMSGAPAPYNETAVLRELAERALVSKRSRLTALEAKKPVPRADRVTQWATALHGAFYTFIRDAFSPADGDAKAAAWWFLREFCYGSMFRYNKAGHFNIPYGGASYNAKDLTAKVAILLDPATKALFGRATLTDLDFRDFFTAYGTGRDDDFLFLDPPYDTEFSDYANRPFGQRDQEALAEAITACRAKTMLVIKRTDFIEDLYSRLHARDPRIEVALYDHKYGYNVRGRNERQVDHLMITTYPLEGADR